MRLVIGMVLMFVAQILTFLQVQGHLKYQSFKENYWLCLIVKKTKLVTRKQKYDKQRNWF